MDRSCAEGGFEGKIPVQLKGRSVDMDIQLVLSAEEVPVTWPRIRGWVKVPNGHHPSLKPSQRLDAAVGSWRMARGTGY